MMQILGENKATDAFNKDVVPFVQKVKATMALDRPFTLDLGEGPLYSGTTAMLLEVLPESSSATHQH